MNVRTPSATFAVLAFTLLTAVHPAFGHCMSDDECGGLVCRNMECVAASPGPVRAAAVEPVPPVGVPGKPPADGGGAPVPPGQKQWKDWQEVQEDFLKEKSHDDMAPIIRRAITGQKGIDKTGVKPDPETVEQVRKYFTDEDRVQDLLQDQVRPEDKPRIVAAFNREGTDPQTLRGEIDKILHANKTSVEIVRQMPEMRQNITTLRYDMEAIREVSVHMAIMNNDALSMGLMSPKDRGGHIDNTIAGAGGNPAPYIYAGKDALREGDVAQGVRSLSKALQLDPNNSEALTLRAQGNFMQHDLAGAAKDAAAALRIDPGNDKAQKLYNLSAGRGGYDAAGSAGSPGGDGTGFGSGGGSSGGSGLAMYGAGVAQSEASTKDAMAALRLGDYNSAISHLTRAIGANPNNAQAYDLRAIAYNRSHQYDLALQDAVQGLKVAPKNVALLLNKAVALNKLKRYKDAEAAAREALELDPNNAQAYNALAEALAGQHRNAEAIAALKSAAGLDPRFDARLQAALQLPAASDLAFLFPDDDAAGATAKAGPADQARGFKAVATASIVGGALLALGLLSIFMPKIKEAVTRLTRTGPSVTHELPMPAPSLMAPIQNGDQEGLLRGQYRLGRQIGVGGMGMVFEGKDLALKRRVAVKKMRDEIRLDRRERERFVTEARVVAALHHPSIVDVFAILEENDDVFLVFEYIDGKTLHEIVHGSGPLGLGRAVSLIKAAGEALDYAHSRNIIHRDLKPSNIMVSGDGRVKVMDFGIARLAKDAMAHYSLTNTVVGTPPYMAPEQEQGVVRRESDVYALGICLYEMISGKLPFHGTGSGMLLNKINKTYIPVSQLASGLPAGIDEIMSRAFDPDPEKRFHSAKEFVGALEALAQPA